MKPDAIEIAVAPDVTLRGQMWPGDGVFVLLCHEPGEDRDLDLWRPLIPYLLGAGVTAIALDLRGHGASGGDWEPARSVDDLVVVVTEVRRRDAYRIVVCAAGESANSALRAAELTSMDGLVLLSPSVPGPAPRGAGEPKLVIRGIDNEARTQIDNLRSSVIGPTLFVTVPGKDSGTGLFAGEVAITCREQFLAFLRKVRSDEQGAATAPDRFLKLLGIHGKGRRA